jgi:hypothetical protein
MNILFVSLDDNDDENGITSANDEPFDTEKLKSEAAIKGNDRLNAYSNKKCEF